MNERWVYVAALLAVLIPSLWAQEPPREAGTIPGRGVLKDGRRAPAPGGRSPFDLAPTPPLPSPSSPGLLPTPQAVVGPDRLRELERKLDQLSAEVQGLRREVEGLKRWPRG